LSRLAENFRFASDISERSAVIVPKVFWQRH
jgi:hypothetical protein